MAAVSDTVVAVDFGASSIRVCRVDLGTQPPTLQVVHRHVHGPIVDRAGHLRWDWSRLTQEMETGLAIALEMGPVASIGVDTWGVDYGLLDAHGELIAPPFSYRDHRTRGFAEIVERIGAETLYGVTGVQLQPYNTIFQLAVHPPAELARARRVVTLPELLVHHLTGEIVAERTSAGTTALLDIRRGEWSEMLIEAIGLHTSLFAEVATAGRRVGSWRGIPVHLVGGHDTASAVIGMGETGLSTAFVSAGTWLLIGRERAEPDLGNAARLANFTNELGALGGIRFLKNLVGSWLLDRCRATWGWPAVDDLLAAAEVIDPGPTFDVADSRFLNPADAVAEVILGAGLEPTSSPAVVVQCIVDSMAAGTAAVTAELGDVSDVIVFGGGSRSSLYLRELAGRTGLPVRRGPVEATALGNALVQGIALGRFAGLDDARASLRDIDA